MPRLLLIAERCPPDIGGSEVFPQPKILNLKYSGSQKSQVCPMPYALCPVVPHLSEKGYRSMLAILK